MIDHRRALLQHHLPVVRLLHGPLGALSGHEIPNLPPARAIPRFGARFVGGAFGIHRRRAPSYFPTCTEVTTAGTTPIVTVVTLISCPLVLAATASNVRHRGG